MPDNYIESVSRLPGKHIIPSTPHQLVQVLNYTVTRGKRAKAHTSDGKIILGLV